MEKIYSKQIIVCILFCALLFPYNSLSQAPTCDSNVPYYEVDLRGRPEGTWTSSSHIRQGKCCGVVGSDNCTSFRVLLDSNAVAVNFNITSGAIPSGSMFYQIGCGTQVPVGNQICISGPGPHYITFCKPGNNENTYSITSISRPVFPADTTVRIGCSKKLPVYGLNGSSVTWTSISPGVQGQYNSYLSCTNCTDPNFTPASGAPAYVDYRVCGLPVATLCGYTATVCDTVRINIANALSGTVNPNPASFCQTGSGSGVLLTAQGSGGNNSYSYIWRNDASVVVGTSATYFASSAGTYTVEIRDGLYNATTCPSVVLSVPVTEIPLPVANAGSNQTVCASNARVNLSGNILNSPGGTWSGGTGTFSPSSSSTTSTYWASQSEIESGGIDLILTTNSVSGCPADKDTVHVTFPAPLTASINSGVLNCNSSSATLTATANGGNAPYSYSWSNGSNTPSITVSSGNYCLTVEDNLGCTYTTCTNLVAPSPLLIETTSTGTSANGSSDGSATAIPVGGTAPYTYLWSNGATDQTATGLSYGIYSVSVTDSKGCTITGSVVVNEPRCLGMNVTISHTDLSCSGDMTASATATVTGGVEPYSYQWNDPANQTTAIASNLAAGSYTVNVTNGAGCMVSANVTILDPQPVTNTFNYQNATNFTNNNGWISANPFGGTGPYTYSWSNGATGQTISGLSPGNYSVTITDSKGCSITDAIGINSNACAGLHITIDSQSPDCFGGNNGSATVNIHSGSAPYTINWSTGVTSPTVTGITAGSYSVTVTDNGGCSQTRSVSVTQPSGLSLGLSPTMISCFGSNNGTVETSVSGGEYPYVFSWSNGSSVEDLINLPVGNYSLTVTDNNNCIVSKSIQILEPQQLAASNTSTVPTCNAGSNGAIDLSVNGGVIPYSYNWSNGEISEDLSGISSGTFQVVITDANNCTLGNTLDINLAEPPAVSVASVTMDCPLPGSDQINTVVSPSGGNGGPYEISWDNGNTFNAAGNYTAILIAGNTYNVIVKDVSGCTIPSAYILNVDLIVVIDTITFSRCFIEGTSQTSVVVIPSGGDGGPYEVSFDNGTTFETAGDYSKDLTVGTSYTVVIRDSKGCLSLPNTIIIPAPFTVTIDASIFDGGFNIACSDSANGEANAIVSGGTAPYEYAWTGPGGFSSASSSLSGLEAGTYTVTVTDDFGCTANASMNFTEPDPISIGSVNSSASGGYNITCHGASTGNISLNVSGGDTASYQYTWTGPDGFTSNQKDLSGVTAGTYFVTITDANGCSASDSITLTQPDSLVIAPVVSNVSGGYNISCFGSSNGFINLNISGGDSTSYSFAWTGPNGFTSNQMNLSGLVAGTYMIVVTDANGCSESQTITLTQPDSLVIAPVVSSVSGGYNISCFGTSNGFINLNIIGGDSTNYSYSWSGPNGFTSTQKDLSGLVAGTYTIVVTDANGCSATQSITLTQPDSIMIGSVVPNHSGGYNISCHGTSNGFINLNVSGGDTASYQYTWTGPDGFTSNQKDLSGVTAGTYFVTITDANGCSASDSITLTQPDSLVVTILPSTQSGGFNISCHGASDGTLSPGISGGDNSSYTYSWTGPDGYTSTALNISNLTAGTYQLTVTDANGCSAIASATLTQPDSLLLNNAVSQFNGNNISCNGSADGWINLNASGGDSSSYLFSWTGPDGFSGDSSYHDGLTAGTYEISLTDANGCSAMSSITLTQPDVLSGSVMIVSDYNGYGVSCHGGNNGELIATVSGGTIPYSYQWNNGDNSQHLSNIPAGVYSVTATDLNGCEVTASAQLTQPDTILISSNVTNVLCNGFATGTVDLSVSGGIAPYAYSWSNGEAVPDIDSLNAGTFSVNVTDQNNCSYVYTATVSEEAPVVTTVTSTNETCNESNNGTITVIPSGGVMPYSATWSTGEPGFERNNLQAGTYIVTVSDDNNCSKTDTVTVTEPDVLTADLTPVVFFNTHNVTFFNSQDGSIQCLVSGGTVPYTFQWSNGISTQNLDNLAAGTYEVLITDNNGCTYLTQVTLTQPDDLEMPEGISPNNDGKNDAFVVRGLEAYPNNKLIVVNRWGNTVFSAEPYNNGWNGVNSKGEALPDGTYFVVLTINGGEITLKGFVEIRK